MAASSPSLSNTFSLYSSPRFSLSSSSSSPTKFLANPSNTHKFFNPNKPISSQRFHLSAFLGSNDDIYSKSPIIVNRKYKNRMPYLVKASVSAQQAQQVPENEPDLKSPSSLKSLMQVYREAILIGDKRTVHEIEAMIYTMEKEKNDLVEKVSALSSEISSGKEKYLRLQADFDNYRKRSEKEKLTVRSDARGEVIENLLPMVDSFERAKQQVKPETEKEKKIDTSYQGIYKQFVEIMRSLRVAVVPTVGKPFDPSMHEAIAREESQEFKEGIITQEFRRGFFLGNRLLRPAMVKVSSGPGKMKPPSVAEKSSQQPNAVAGIDSTL